MTAAVSRPAIAPTTVFLPGPPATDALGRALAATQPSRAVVHLHGDLGSGKSSLARAWLRAVGVAGAIRSPTYTLVERYRVPGGEALHIDLYRIGDASELEFLGLDDTDAALWLVEWPDRGAGALPAADLTVHLTLVGQGRSAVIAAETVAGEAWLERLDGVGHLRRVPESLQ